LFFADLRSALMDTVRSRVRNGQVTERGLAKALGISQPHMHNVLKGTRSLSPELCDRVLAQMRLSTLDLVATPALQRHLSSEQTDPGQTSFLPVLQGRLGPSHPWPQEVETHERFPVTAVAITRMWHPVVVRLSADPHMHPLFGEGDTALLDQSQAARMHFDPEALYVIKWGGAGLVRRIRRSGQGIYMVAHDAADRPTEWVRLPCDEQPVSFFVRARATLITREVEWLV
jgi:hypothetical protein